MVLGITGYKGSGKTTISNYLVKEHGFVPFSLSAPIKEVASLLFGWSSERIEGEKETLDRSIGLSPRQFLQTFGTDFMQHYLSDQFPQYKATIGRLFWVKLLLTTPSFRYSRKAAISDIRFLHEVAEFRSVFHEMFNLISIVSTPRGTQVGDPHSSESEHLLLNPDFTVYNDGNLEESYHSLDVIIHQLEGSRGWSSSADS